MSRAAITVENLGKRYEIRHEVREPYTTLRDVLARKAAAPLRWWRARSGGAPSRKDSEEFWALKNVAFSIGRGEVVGIIGRNGAGKSTLLKILSRVTEPTTGRIAIRGRVASLLEVGTGFHPELTGRENVFLNGAILGMKRAEISRKFDEIVAFAEVEKFLDTPVKRYSSGMYVRLAFAVAAHLEPEILIVDEVLAVGDAAFQEKCLGKINNVAKTDGRTVLFVSHNMAAVQQLCGRALLLRNGEVVEDGAPAGVVRAYLTDTHDSAKVSLRNWTDRTSNGDARITDFEVMDESGAHTTTIPFGGAVRFKFGAEFHRPVTQPVFGVLIHSANGEAMLDLRSFHGGMRLARADGLLEVEVAVEQLGLYPGEYTLSPWIFDGAGKTDVDWARHCCTLRVAPAPGPHGDLKLDPSWGKYWVPSEWTARPVAEQHLTTR